MECHKSFIHVAHFGMSSKKWGSTTLSFIISLIHQGERQMQIDTTEALSGADWQEAIASLAAMHDQSLQPDIRVHNAVISACRRGTLELSF